MNRSLIIIFALVSLVLGACATHIAPYRPKRRHFDPGKYAKAPTTPTGSLYASGSAGFFEDSVASQLGDILVIRIDERESALRDASTKLDQQSSTSYGVPSALGLMGALQSKYPNVDPSALFGAESDVAFQGGGKIARKGALNATLSVRVQSVMPNGDLYVEGTKVVMVGQEEHHIYVSGIVRRDDILPDNSVRSSRIADAEIEYVGRGDVSNQQRRGWFSRTLSKLWPF